MDQYWIRGYKNGKRFIRNDIGDIGIHPVDEESRFYPVISMTKTGEVECSVSYGDLK